MATASLHNKVFQDADRTMGSYCKICTPPTPKKHSDMEVHNSNIDIHDDNPIKSGHCCSSCLEKICAPERKDVADIIPHEEGEECVFDSTNATQTRRSGCLKRNTVTYNITPPHSTNYKKRHVSCLWPWFNITPKPWPGFDKANPDGCTFEDTKGGVGSIKETKKEEAKTIRTSLVLVDGILHSAEGIELEEQDKLGGSADPEKITIDSGVASLGSVE